MKSIIVSMTFVLSLQHAHADPLNDCINALEHDSALQPISDKVSLVGKEDRLFGMMANESFPTSNEKEAIFAWATKRERCINDNPPPNNPITQVNMEGFNSIQLLILDLYKGTITYGQFAKQRHEIAKMLYARIQQYQQQQNYQHQQMCESLKQQILIAANSGPTPQQAWQQQHQQENAIAQQAFNNASGTPGQLMARGYAQAGSGLVGLVAGMMGVEPVSVVKARQAQALLSRNVDYYKRECQ